MEKKYFNYFKFKSFVAVLLAIALFATAIPSLGKDASAEDEQNQEEAGEELDLLDLVEEEEKEEEEEVQEPDNEIEDEEQEEDQEENEQEPEDMEEKIELIENLQEDGYLDNILDELEEEEEEKPLIQGAAFNTSVAPAYPAHSYHGALWRTTNITPQGQVNINTGHYIREEYLNDDLVIVTLFRVSVQATDEDIIVLVSDAADGNTLVAGLGNLSSSTYAKLPSITELDGTEYQDFYDNVMGSFSGTFRRTVNENDGYFIVPKGTNFSGGISGYVQIYTFYDEDREVPFFELDDDGYNGDTRVVYGLQTYSNVENGGTSQSGGSGDYTFFTISDPDVSLDQSADKINGLKIGDKVRMSVTVDNTSDIWLENVLVDLYNEEDDTGDSRLTGTIDNVDIEVHDDDTQIILDPSSYTSSTLITGDSWHQTPYQDPAEDGQFVIGGWAGSEMISTGVAGKSVTDDASITISFDYTVHKDDINASGKIPVRAEITATTPERAYNGNSYADDDFNYYKYTNASSNKSYSWTIDSLSDDAVTFLELAQPDVTLDKSVSKAKAYVGETLTYTITASNAANAGKWVNGVITDTFPDELEYITGTFAINGTLVTNESDYISGNTIRVENIELDSSEDMIITFNTKILTSAAGKVLTNNAEGTGETVEGNEYNPDDSPEVKTEVPPLPDVELDKEVSHERAYVGDILTYKITVSNKEGAGKWVNGKIVDAVSSDLKYVPHSLEIDGTKLNDDGTYITGNTITVEGLELDGGESLVITFEAEVLASAAGKTVKNGVVGTGENEGGNEHDPEDPPETETRIWPWPEVTLKKKVSAARAHEGEILTYTVIASNADGAEKWLNGTLTDEIPLGLEYVQGSLAIDGDKVSDDSQFISGRIITIKDIALDGGEHIEISFQAEVLSEAVRTTVVNVAQATGEDGGGNASNPDDSNEVETYIYPLPDVTLEKEVSARRANVGGILTYTIKASNAENAGKWINGTIVDVISDDIEYIEGSLRINGSGVDDESIYLSGKTLMFTAVELDGGESLEITFKVTVLESAAGKTVTNAVVGTGENEGGGDYDPEDPPETITDINPLPDMTLEKEVSAVRTKVGDTLKYTITAANAVGAGKWVNGTITDVLSGDAEFIEGSLKINGSGVSDESLYLNGKTLEFTAVELEGGETLVIVFEVKVLPSAAGKTILNAVVGTGKGEGGGDYDPEDPPETRTEIDPNPDVKLTKEVSAEKAKVGDILTYTITAVNQEGAGVWKNGTITDELSEYIEYVSGSLKINGTSISDESQYIKGNIIEVTGIELEGGESLTIVFEVEVLESAAGKTVKNAVVGSGDDYDPEDPPETTTEIDPNPDKPNVELKKEVSAEKAKVGDILTYTITAVNQEGAGVWKNGTITDELSEYVEYIAGSLKINGTSIPDESKYITGNILEVTGIELEGGESLTIVFEVEVLESAAGKTVTNAVVGSGDDHDPKEPPETITEVDPDPDKPNVELKKEVSAEKAKVGDILTYTITAVNQEGAGVWKNGIITDELSKYVEYIAGSLKINGTSILDESQYITENIIEVTGIGLEGGESLTIQFEVEVLESAAGKTVTNAVVGSGDDHDPKEPPETTTEIDPDPDKPNVELKKEVSAEKAKVGDILTYTITVENQEGAGTWKNGTITDELSKYVEYVSGSLKINGTSISDEGQYIIGNILEVTGIELEGGESLMIVFEVEVLESAAGKTVTNAVVGSGDDHDPKEPPETTTEVDPDPDKPNVELKKEVSAEKAKVGDILTYTITAANQEGAGVWKNGIITDELSKYVEYVSGSLKINGTSISDEGLYITENILEVTGIELEGGESLTIVFEVEVLESAAGKTVTNAVVGRGDDYDPEDPPETKTEVDPDPDKPNVELKKEVSAEKAKVGDILTYTITAANQEGAGVWKNGIITDELSQYVEYVSGSLKINGTSISDEGQYITGNILEVTGIELEGGESLTIEFEVEVLESAAGKTITNAVVGSGDDHDPEDPPETKTEVDPDPDKPNVELKKEVSAEKAKVGDILTYTITAENQEGAGTWKNGTITDELSKYVEYVSGSLKIDGTSIPDESQYITENIIEVTGIELEGGESLTIVFEVEVLESAAGKTVTNAVVGSGDDHDPEDPPETTTEIEPDPDKPNVKLQKEVSTEKAKVGDVLTYTISAVNQEGAGIWKNGTITDELSQYVEYISGSLKIDGNDVSDESRYITGNIIEVTGIELEGGESLTIIFEVEVLESAAGKTVTNAVVGSGDDYDPKEPPETKTEIDPDPDKPNVELKKEVSTEKAQVGDILTYTITAANQEGAGTWKNGTLTDELSDYVEHVSGSLKINGTSISDESQYITAKIIEVTGVELEGGETLTIVFEVEILESAAGKTVTNAVVGRGDDYDPEEPPETKTEIDPEPDLLDPDPSIPEVTLNKVASSEKANVGDTLTYTITAINREGAGKWINGKIIDILPEEVSYVNGSLCIDGQEVDDTRFVKDNTIIVTDIELQGGTGIGLVFQVKVLAAAEGKTITNIATATGQNENGGESNPKDSPKAETYINKKTATKVSDPTTGSAKKSGTSKSPKTGDETMLTIVLLLLAGSVILIRVSGKRKRKM